MKQDADSLLASLIDGTLDPKTFGHRAHIGVAYAALARHDFFDATSIVARGLRQMAERAGAPDKFNATITWSFMSVIAERMRAQPDAGFDAFLNDNSDLTGPAILEPWYSRQRLNSDLARSVALLPDRAPPSLR